MLMCDLCGVEAVDHHEIIHGNGRRQKAQADGLQVYVCRKCHTHLHHYPKSEISRKLKELAQRKYMENHTLAEFQKRYGGNYLNGYYDDYYDFDEHIRELGREEL